MHVEYQPLRMQEGGTGGNASFPLFRKIIVGSEGADID